MFSRAHAREAVAADMATVRTPKSVELKRFGGALWSFELGRRSETLGGGELAINCTLRLQGFLLWFCRVFLAFLVNRVGVDRRGEGRAVESIRERASG